MLFPKKEKLKEVGGQGARKKHEIMSMYRKTINRALSCSYTPAAVCTALASLAIVLSKGRHKSVSVVHQGYIRAGCRRPHNEVEIAAKPNINIYI